MVLEEQESSLGLASESIPVPQIHNSLQQPCEQMLDQGCNVSRGKPRLRKKALHASILKQMEFYFSDANLSKDRFLGNLIKADPYIDLNVFLSFNKIRALTEDVNRLTKALKNSTILELSEDGTKVRRTTPINPRENCEACTIYVQGLPPDVTHEWLSNLFSQYGSIAYISIPRYKSSRKIKGFAFIEFDKAEGADECLKAFGEQNCILPSHTAPHELLSITTYAEDNPSAEMISAPEPTIQASGTNNIQKRKADDVEICENGDEGKKRTRLDSATKESDVPKNENQGENTEIEKDEASQNEGEESGNDNLPKGVEKKKKRKRKHRSRSEKADVADLGLQIMAKKEWKQLRNKYLQLQRNKMKQLKQHLQKTRWNQWGGNYDRKERMETDETPKDSKDKSEVSAPKFSFTPGVIVKIDLDEPCSNPKSFKLELRGETGVQYIDVFEGSGKAHIRCDTATTAQSFVEKYKSTKNVSILEGAEEKRYWKKILEDREERLSKKDRVKQRGREKLLKKAEKELGKHIKFEEV